MAREIVSLEQAWFWACPSCGKPNYARSVQVDDMPEETLREALDLDTWEPIPDDAASQFVTAPEVVTCAHCAVEFDCFEDHEDPGDLDDDPPDVPDALPEDFGRDPG